MKDDFKQRRAARHLAELAAQHAAAPGDYKRGGALGWQRGTTDEITCRMLVCFVLWNQPRAQWFENSPRATTLTFPSVKANGTVVCTLDSQAYSTLLNDTIGQQHLNNSQLEERVKGWMQTHQPGEPALLCNFAA